MPQPPQDFLVRGFEALCPHAGRLGLSCSPVVPPGLSECGIFQLPADSLPALSASCCFDAHPPHPGSSSLPLLPVWINVSLTPWLSHFYTVRYSGRSGCFLFLNWLLSFFWLCEEAKCIHLHVHLGQKYSCVTSTLSFFPPLLTSILS